MVVNKNTSGQTLIKSSENRKVCDQSQSEILKTKIIKGNQNFKNPRSPLSSPSKIPLMSSSLANINNLSPVKLQPIIQKTPKKNQQQTPNKHSLELNKLTPSPERDSPSKHGNTSTAVPATSPAGTPAGYLSTSPLLSIKLEGKSPSSPISEVYSADNTSPFESGSIIEDTNLDGSCRKQMAETNSVHKNKLNPPVSRRNARERNRVKQVSMGFAILRQHVPQGNRKKKLSKVETLRCAVEYIKNLQSLLQENPVPLHTSSSTIQSKTHPNKYHFDTSPEQLIRLHINHQNHSQNENNIFTVKKLGQIQGVLAHTPLTDPYFENRVHLQQMQNSSIGGSSRCLDAQVLKVPKVEDSFQSQDYNTSIFSEQQMDFVKDPSQNYPTTQAIFMEDTSCLQENKDPLSSLPSAVQEYNHKDLNDVDLMEALNWWQQNS